MNKIKIGIIGAAGYTGGELIRLLVHHPKADIVFAHSKSNFGKYIHEVHTDLIGDIDLQFTNEFRTDIEILFLCLAHGESLKFIEQNPVSNDVRIIDLSEDFRSRKEINKLNGFIYGLPELNRDEIKNSRKVANPGCFATCIQLGLLPLASKKLLNEDIHISATTGSTGAGQSFSTTSHFSWRQNNLSVYKAFGHQHLVEIGQSINQLQPGFNHEIHFIPYRGAFTRGILASIYLKLDLDIDEVRAIYETYYSSHPFVHISTSTLDLKQVVNSNKCLIHLEKHDDQLLITSCIDNLLKGASGQAVQNMNLMFGLEESRGLRLKANYF
jgi:N-acetyl-gamma-glutamyl-phosphate reductase